MKYLRATALEYRLFNLAVIVAAIWVFTAQADEPAPSAPQKPVAADASTPASNSMPSEGAEFRFKVVSTDGKPVVGAKVRPWAMGIANGSFGLPADKFPPVETDDDGVARIVIPQAGDDPHLAHFKNLHKDDINRMALEIKHPDHPTWSNYKDIGEKAQITVVDPTTVEITAHRNNDTAVVDRLYPMLASPDNDWSQANGLLTLRRVDLLSDDPSRWLRIVQAPEKGPAWFSELIDLKKFAARKISMEVALKPGVRMLGQLPDNVPRTVKHGRVVAEVIDGTDTWNSWFWQAAAEIAPDGTFVLDSLPADENLQIIAICDGWISSSPSADQVHDFVQQQHWKAINYNGPDAGSVYPQLFRTQRLALNAVVPMDPTAACEIIVQDENNAPIANAKVAFWPNQHIFFSGSRIVGNGADSLAAIREQLNTGKVKDSNFDWDAPSRYSAKTDAQGKATIDNLPAGKVEEGAQPVETWFMVTHDGYIAVPNTKPPRMAFASKEPELRAAISPGQTESITIHMQKAQ